MAKRLSAKDLIEKINSSKATLEMTYDVKANKLVIKENGKEFWATLSKEILKFFQKQSLTISSNSIISTGNKFRITGNVSDVKKKMQELSRGITFNQYCGYLFEILFFQELYNRAGMLKSAAADPGYQRQVAIVNTYENTHFRKNSRAKWESSKQAMMNAITNAFDTSDYLKEMAAMIKVGLGQNVTLGEESNTPDDITIIVGNYHLAIDLKSLGAEKDGTVEWVGYTTKLSRELGITSFLDYVEEKDNGQHEIWRVMNGDKLISDESWAKKLTEGGEKSVVNDYMIAKIATKGAPFKNFLQKGDSGKNLGEKILIINSRPPDKNGWKVNITVNMDEVLNLLTDPKEKYEFKRVTDAKKMPPNWRKLDAAYIYYKLVDVAGKEAQDPMAAFSLNLHQIKQVGYYTQLKGFEEKKANKDIHVKTDVAIGFALNHNALRFI